MFKAMVTKDKCHIIGNKDISNMMLSVTMICRSIYECDQLSDSDRELFKDFVQDELGRITFMSEEEIRKENKKMVEEKQALEKKLKDILKGALTDDVMKEIFKTLEEALDEEDA